MNRYLLLDILQSNGTSFQEFNNIFKHKIKEQVILIGSKWKSTVHQAEKLLNIQNINSDYLDKLIFSNDIDLRWPTEYFHDSMEMDLDFVKNELGKFHGDRIRFVNAYFNTLDIEVVKHVKGPISVRKLLKELDILGRNFNESGFFEGLKKQGNREIYQVSWAR
jgi:hypothetical protein